MSEANKKIKLVFTVEGYIEDRETMEWDRFGQGHMKKEPYVILEQMTIVPEHRNMLLSEAVGSLNIAIGNLFTKLQNEGDTLYLSTDEDRINEILKGTGIEEIQDNILKHFQRK